MDRPLHQVGFILVDKPHILGGIDDVHHPFGGDDRFLLGSEQAGDRAGKDLEQPRQGKEQKHQGFHRVGHEDRDAHIVHQGEPFGHDFSENEDQEGKNPGGIAYQGGGEILDGDRRDQSRSAEVHDVVSDENRGDQVVLVLTQRICQLSGSGFPVLQGLELKEGKGGVSGFRCAEERRKNQKDKNDGKGDVHAHLHRQDLGNGSSIMGTVYQLKAGGDKVKEGIRSRSGQGWWGSIDNQVYNSPKYSYSILTK